MKMTTTVSVARALSSRYGITVKMQGNVAKTNGKSITIPDLGSSLDEEKLILLRGYLDHEAGGHGRHTDFDALLGLEKPEVASLSNALEDIRVEALLSAEFTGCRNNLAALNDRLFGGPEAAQSPVNSLLVNGFKRIAGQPLKTEMDIALARRCFGEDIMERVADCRSTQDCIDLAQALVAELESKAEEERRQPAPTPADSESGEGEEQSGKESADNGEEEQGEQADGQPESGEAGEGEDAVSGGASEEKQDGADDSAESDKGGESGADVEGKGEAGAGEDEKPESGADDRPDGEGESEASAGQPEYGGGDTDEPSAERALEALRSMPGKGEVLGDMLAEVAKENLKAGGYSVFSTEYDRIEPVNEASSDYVYRRLRDGLGSLNTMRGKVARAFQSEKAIRWEGDRDRGKINNRALFKVAVGSNRVFKQRVESRHVDTAATFLVDFSGSMQNYAGSISRIERAMSAVVLFLESLEQAGVASEVLGYTTGEVCKEYFEQAVRERAYNPFRSDTYGRIENLLTFVFKGFNERMSARIRRRISAYEGCEMNENCDADSLRVAYERIMQRKERRKVIFVLTDGSVCSNGNDEAGMAELKRLAEAIERQGAVELVAVDFMSGCADRYYSKVITVRGKDDLAAKLLDGLKRFLF